MDEDQVQEASQEESSVSQDGFVVLGEEVNEAQVVAAGRADLTSDATVLTSLDELIKATVASMDRLRVEMKKHKEMLEDAYNNDPVYHENAEQAKAAAKKKNETKQNILKQPAMQTIANKVKTMVAEIKDKQFSLSDYLLEYQRLSGANQIEVGNGEILEIVNTAKVVRKSSGK